MSRIRVTAFALAAIAALLATSDAAAGWSDARTISGPHDFLAGNALGYTADGRAVATLHWVGAARSNGSVVRTSMASQRGSRGAFAPERPLTPLLVAGPEPYGEDRVMIATQNDRVDRRTRKIVASTLSVRFGDLGGRFGAPHVIQRSPVQINGGVRLVANARGDAVLSWLDFVSLRRRGGDFGRPIRLAHGAESVAIGPAGDVLLAYNDRGIHTRFKRRADGAFGPPDKLRSKPTRGAFLHTSLTADGSAWVAWVAQWRTEGGTVSTPYVQLARRRAGARRFDRALLLAQGAGAGGDYGTTISFATAARGRAGVAWVAWRGVSDPQTMTDVGVSTVRVALVDADGRVTIDSLARFSADDPGADASLTFADDGAAAVAWTAFRPAPRSTTLAFVSRRPARGTWSAPEVAAEGPSLSQLIASYPPDGEPLTLMMSRAAKGATRARMHVITATKP